jgi:hypothetical protein
MHELPLIDSHAPTYRDLSALDGPFGDLPKVGYLQWARWSCLRKAYCQRRRFEDPRHAAAERNTQPDRTIGGESSLPSHFRI